MLHLENITKDYVTSSETVKALRGINISFREKEFVSVLGPSGCGKTTLLNIIGGLDHYTDGDLVINGRSTKSYKDRDWDVYRNHRVGFIFQSYNLIPHQNVLSNVELALTIAGIDREERIARAKAALDKVGLSGQYYKRPNQLSGGQCQRVAIARALVNNPEILLADEPTGALDTVTSVQIMDLIREIAGERLVIMVTHNPELAEKYSTRIVKLLDGEVVEDSNPMTPEEETREAEELAKREAELAKKELEDAENSTRVASSGKKVKKKAKKEKAKMSFFTAFRLSAKNLLTKKGRTAMVGFAGSIGIFGIAVVLAFSTGITGYVESMQDDMLSGNPVTIQENTYDLEALTGMMNAAEKAEIIKVAGRVYADQIVKYLAEMSEDVENFMVKNTITKDYIDFVKAMPKEYYAAMKLGYGIELANNIYTDFERYEESDITSITAITNNYTSILEQTELKKYASYVESVVPSFEQAPNSAEYIASQYQVHGKVATEKNEIMLVLDSDHRLADVLLARLGYYTQNEFEDIIYEATLDNYTGKYKDYFTYDELMGKSFYWLKNDAIFTLPTDETRGKNASYGIVNILTDGTNTPTLDYTPTIDAFSTEDGIELKVVGILIPNENTAYGCMRSGIYYTEALTNHIIADSAKSKIVEFIKEYGSVNSTEIEGVHGPTYLGIHYAYDVYFDVDQDGALSDAEVIKTANPMGKSPDMQDLISEFMGTQDKEEPTPELTSSEIPSDGAGMGGSGMGGTGMGGSGMGGSGMSGSTNIMQMITSMKSLDLRQVGGDSVANSVAIYPNDFDSKDLVTDYLDLWNGDGVVAGLSADKRDNIKYTDTLELIIGLINGMIQIITTALVAFTSISLIVSTVMIGIITYVSVVERIKEIGVIRSIGGRKKDVSHLFNAETFIIGLLAGLIGIGFTLIVSLIGSAILKHITGIGGLVDLKLSHAIILIALSIALTLISGLIPAKSAANKDPIEALRVQ